MADLLIGSGISEQLSRTRRVEEYAALNQVVGRQGLGGYAGEVTGDPLKIKRWLLRHEGVDVDW